MSRLEGTTRATNPWYPYPSQRPASTLRERLFCLPTAAGSASLYRRWVDECRADLEIVPVELPGRLTRTQDLPIRELRPLLAALYTALEPLLDRPFALFGYGLGAFVQFELARELRRRGGPAPRTLYVAAASAPQVLRIAGPPSRELSDDALAARVAERYGPLPGDLLGVPELRGRRLRMLRADLNILESYQHEREEPLACPIVALRGKDDTVATRDAMQAWRAQTSSEFSLHEFEGGHFFLRDAWREVLARISG